ncbi:MAG: Ig-like domain-containing protein [Verrucomicrobiota bacterium]
MFGQTLRPPEYAFTTTQAFSRGIDRRYYEGNWSQLPDFNALPPLKTQFSDGFDLIRYNSGFNFGYYMTGFIDVKNDGTYTFYTSSSDGSRLYIGNTLVVDNDGLHAMQERSGSIGLQAGKHAITVTYFHSTGPFEPLEVRWQGPNLGKQIMLTGGSGTVVSRIDEGVTHSRVNTYIQIDAQVNQSPPQITLSWTADPVCNSTGFTVYRKGSGATSWGNPLATLDATTFSYTDSSVAVGTGYEYKVEASCSAVDFAGANGLIYAGIELPLMESRGKVILLVDNLFSANLAPDLSRLEQDLVGDGWTVLRHDVSRTDSVPNIKSIIEADYSADPANVKALFLFGHVPIPYSGFYRPGHNNSTQGAWASDTFYGNFTGPWTDSRVDTRTEIANESSVPLNKAIANIPGDGKYDQTFLPSDVALQIGRVDFWKITAFAPKTEEDLLRQYLNKDHNFRHVMMSLPQRRGYMQNNGNLPLIDGYNLYSACFGRANIDFYDGSRFTWSKLDHLCAMSLPPPNFAGADYKAVFIMTIISGVAQWDVPDATSVGAGRDVYSMQEALGMPTYSLTSAATLYWGWYLHHMALGETIGYGVRLSQNNTGLYPMTAQAGDVAMEMMGDPTLRLHPVVPPAGLIANVSNGNVNLSWGASTDTSIQGYHVYRTASPKGPFSRVNSVLLQTTSYTDSGLGSGTYIYLVRAVKLENSGSGSYFNPSQGIILSASVTSSGNNLPPSVSLTSPAANAAFTAPATITLSATAGDSDGSVSQVEFFNGTTLLGTANTSPYTFDWIGVPPGNYILTAKATDSANATAVSSAVSVTVNPLLNSAPIVFLTSPTQNAVFTAPASIILSAVAIDTDGTVSKVEFFDGATLLGKVNASPYTFDWTGVPPGKYLITAKATDDANASTTSLPVSIKVDSTATLTISFAGGEIVISWTGPGTLEFADGLPGPWFPVASPANPYSEAISGVERFYRLR